MYILHNFVRTINMIKRPSQIISSFQSKPIVCFVNTLSQVRMRNLDLIIFYTIMILWDPYGGGTGVL